MALRRPVKAELERELSSAYSEQSDVIDNEFLARPLGCRSAKMPAKKICREIVVDNTLEQDMQPVSNCSRMKGRQRRFSHCRPRAGHDAWRCRKAKRCHQCFLHADSLTHSHSGWIEHEPH